MKVCDLTTLYTEGAESGMNTYLREKARYCSARNDLEHVVIVPGHKTAVERWFGSTVHTIKSRRLPWNEDHRLLFDHDAVRKILRAERPDVVEVDCAYWLGSVARSALEDPGVPIIGFYHVHLPTFIARPGMRRFGRPIAWAVERMAWAYTRRCHRSCDRLVVSSLDIKERLAAEGFERLEHAPLGVNLDLFRPSERSANANAATGSTTILYVGRLSHEKDLEVLFDAFERLPRDGRWRLEVVGDGPLRASLEKRAAERSDITLHGFLPYGEELARIYAAADLFVNPSPNETFSLSILEALASGLPVVAAKRGGPTNSVSTEVGVLAEPSDADDFARCITELAEHRPSSTACRSHVEAKFSWSSSFDRLIEIYADAIGGPRGLRAPSASADVGATAPRPAREKASTIQ